MNMLPPLTPQPILIDTDAGDDATRTLVRPDRLSVFERSPIEPPADDEADDTATSCRCAPLAPKNAPI